MVGWHHWLNGNGFEQTQGDGERQGSPACCSSWGCKELDATQRLNDDIAGLPCRVSFRWQRSDSATHIYLFFFVFFPLVFSIFFPHRLLQDIKCRSLCYTVGPCWLSILYIVVYVCQAQAPNVFPPPLSPLGNCVFVFYVCGSFSVLYMSSFISPFLYRFHTEVISCDNYCLVYVT